MATGLAHSAPAQDIGLEPLDCVISPSVVADLGSGVPGIVNMVRVDRSDMVEAGDVVAELESSVEAAALELAQARAEMDAEVNLRRVNAAFGKRQKRRTQDLFQRKAISTNDMDERDTEARLAAIQLRQALDTQRLAKLERERSVSVLNRRTIKSPITGVVMERFKTIGEYVEDQPVVRIAQLDPLHVEVFVPVEHLGKIRPGMQAEVWTEAVTDSSWKASVSRVDRVADVASGTYGVRLELPNPDYSVPAGLRCQLKFIDAPYVPLATADAAPMKATSPVESSAPTPMMTAAAEEPATADDRSDSAQPNPEIASLPGAAPVQAPEQTSIEDPSNTGSIARAAPPEAPSETAEPAVSTDAVDAVESLISAVATVEPVSESPAAAVADADEPESMKENDPPVAESEQAAMGKSLEMPLCHLVGPFENEQQAKAEARLMRADGFQVEMDRKVLNVQVGYKIASKPLTDFAAAQQMVKDLQAIGFSDYYLPKRRKVSPRVYLGLYHHKADAERRVAKLTRKGFDIELLPWKDKISEVYLLARKGLHGDAEKAAAGKDGAPVGRVSCEQFASR
ncbi:MAG: efflux RND transporter periplasmic adaptor subunit [Sedimenticolaceae bacterium]